MIQIQGLDRVDLTHKLDDVRQRIMAIEDKFGIGGDFQTALNRELNKGIIAQSQQVQSTQATQPTKSTQEILAEARKLLDGSQPVNEADAINSAKVAAALNAANRNANANQNTNVAQPSTSAANNSNSSTRIFPGAEALPGKIMQNNSNPAAGNQSAAISSQNSTQNNTALDEDLFESDDEVSTSDVATSGVSTPEVVSQKVTATATRHGVDPKLAQAIAIAESGLNQDDISEAGAIGVMQLMPATAVSLGVDPYDEDENIEGGVRFLSQMLERFNGNIPLAVAAYNAGPGAVEQYGGIPPYGETQAYVQRVMSLYN